MSGRHGVPPRGLMATGSSPLFQGFFGRMFRNLHPAKFGNTDAENLANLTALGAAMSAGFDKPFDGPDAEESGIPALYTYFGQFIDHDLTFDPTAASRRRTTRTPWSTSGHPAFDLDNLYGRGPDDQPYMYDRTATRSCWATRSAAADPAARDLPRNNAAAGRRAR